MRRNLSLRYASALMAPPFLFIFAAAALNVAPAQVALLCSPAGGQSTQLRFQPLGQTELAPVVAEVAHVPGETTLGAVLPQSKTVLAVVTTTPSRDLSFAGSLVKLEAGKPPRFLADRVVPSTRPLITSDGRVFVQRGTIGTPGNERGAMRVDELTIDEISAATGAARTVLTFKGYFAFLIGAFDGRLLIYRLGTSGADVIAVHPDSLGVERLSPIAPLARDFAIDAANRALYYTQADRERRRWFIERLDLATHQVTALPVSSSDMALLPTLFPNGKISFSPGPGQGLRAVGSDQSHFASTGAGYERLRFFTARGTIAVGLNEAPSDFSTPFAVELRTGTRLPLAAPPKNLLDIAGVTE